MSIKASITQKMLMAAFEKFAQKANLEKTAIQLIVTVADGAVVYKKCEQYKTTGVIEFEQIYAGDTKIFNMVEMIIVKQIKSIKETVNEFLYRMVAKYAADTETPIDRVRVMILNRSEKIYFQLYLAGVDKGPIDYEKLLE